MKAPKLSQQLFAEALGTCLLLSTVVGSGLMAERLAGGNEALALLANALATAAILVVLITMLGPVSGAHFNPIITAAFRARGQMSGKEATCYVIVQFAGAVLGVLIAHTMFDVPLLQYSTKARSGFAQGFSEGVATFGLVTTVLLTRRSRPEAVAVSVGLYVAAAYWFTASTSFANPAVTLARTFTDTFAGVRLADVPMFIAAQIAGAASGLLVTRFLVGGADRVDVSQTSNPVAPP